MKISLAGIELIKYYESLKLTSYYDSANVLTIGWGHTGTDVTENMVILLEEAESLLRLDLVDAENDVNRLVTRTLIQSQFDALVSFQFNTGGLTKSTLLKRVNANRDLDVDDEFVKWVYATVNGKKVKLNGLVTRRAEEARMWLMDLPVNQSSYDATTTPDVVPAKTVAGSVAVQTTSVISIGAVIAEATSKLEPLTIHSDYIKYSFLILSLVGVAYSVYRAWKASK